MGETAPNAEGQECSGRPQAGSPLQVPAPGQGLTAEYQLGETTPGTAGAADLIFLRAPTGPGELGRFGGYRILKLLGSGGMGMVFHAEDVALRRPVALKIMKPALAAEPTARQRFVREGQAAAALHHDQVITIYQVGEDQGVPFLAMEFLQGETLHHCLHRERRLSPAETLRVGREIAQGLAAAHAQGLIHTDIKPSNIWLETDREHGGASRVKILDFGLVRVVAADADTDEASLTQSGMILGTPQYMAPEQASGERVDYRSDLFSLGAVLYRMSAGVTPFAGDNTRSVLKAVMFDPPRPVPELAPDVPAPLADLILKLLSKEPQARPASAGEVVAAIAAIEARLATQGLTASPLPSRRRRLLLGMGVLAAALLSTLLLLPGLWREPKETGNGSPPRPTIPTIPEPPPLAEWLKGRKVLTVAQDGSGQFKTIQAALNALKPGEVVKVLDKGPYTESLRLASCPADIGLISDQQTIVEVNSWSRIDDSHRYYGHVLSGSKGLRINGFLWKYSAPLPEHFFKSAELTNTANGFLVAASRGSGLILENNFFDHVQVPKTIFGFVVFGTNNLGSGTTANFIRDNSFKGRVEVTSIANTSPLVVERNFFHDYPTHLLSFHVGAHALVVRHNVFHNRHPYAIACGSRTAPRQSVFVNNTIVAGEWAFGAFLNSVPPGSVDIRNNIVSNIRVPFGAAKSLPPEVKNWSVGHNCYVQNLKGESLPLTSADFKADPKFLSLNPNDANYLRVPVDSPLATKGAGGDLPSYIGALPPGPAPKEGDWFTRMLTKWKHLREPTIPAIPEPPPLAEWLKGRKILTVAQDGSGQFKTIQAALTALRSGEVIKVLDKGPYREQLYLNPCPEDTGLISECQTIVELSQWKPSAGHPTGHFLSRIKGFRLHGFAWKFPPPLPDDFDKIRLVDDNLIQARGLYLTSSGLVVEQNHFQPGPLPENFQRYNVLLVFGETDGLPCFFRDNDVRGRASFAGTLGCGPLCVTRNFFHGFPGHHLVLGAPANPFLVTHNIFEGTGSNFYGSGKKEAPAGNLVVVNNTFMARSSIVASPISPKGLFRNNLVNGKVYIDPADQARLQGDDGWQVGFNCFTQKIEGKTFYPLSARDIIAEPAFLSLFPNDPGYLRYAANSPLATGGAGGDLPSYIGALPPGPAPKEGDWFTRLLAKWKHLREPAIPTVHEPPPLAEWLKGGERGRHQEDTK